MRLVRPDRYRHLEAVDTAAPRIVRGGGYSYAAAGFGAGALVQDARAFDRVLAFDAAQGTIECEAGATLEKLHSLLTPRGLLSARPSRAIPRITLGGCFAADVHGKNQSKDGNFGRSVVGMRLFHPRHGFLDVGPGDEAFELTRGGLGLTGQIVSLRLQLAPLPSPTVAVKRRADRGGLRDRSPASTPRERTRPFSTPGRTSPHPAPGFGRGFSLLGAVRHGGPDPALSASRVTRPSTRARGAGRGSRSSAASRRPPSTVPTRAAQSLTAAERRLPLFDFLFPVARKVAYFRLFGRRGFHESQFLLPRPAFLPFANELQRFLRQHPTPITLASAKLFDGAGRFLRFEGAGICLALDFPRGPEADRLLRFLDDAIPAHAGRANVMKDSRLSAATARACYPEYEAFKDALHRFDPARLYRSELSVRLGL